MIKLLAITATLALSLPVAFAQTASQDMKDAGHDTKHAATETGHGISRGTKTGYHKTVRGTKKGYHKTAHATKTGIHKVEGRPDTPANNPPR